MLTGPEIKRQVELGRIVLEPFNERQLNANSYDLRLAPELLVYEKAWLCHHWADPNEIKEPLDMKVEEATRQVMIPPEGLVLYPGVLYLACTMEHAGSDWYIPELHGRSSVGRLGMFVHVTAGFGDLGFSGKGRESTWTLEVVVTHPIRVYAGVAVAQICFVSPEQYESLGPLPSYAGKYVGQRGPRPSGVWRDFQ